MSFAIQVQKREAGDAQALRSTGALPGVLYGPEIEAVPVTIEYLPFEKMYEKAGDSSLIDLSVGSDSPIKVLIQDIQYDPVKGRMVHADFRQIKMGEEMHVTIQLNFVGVAPAVKTLGGTLIKTLESINVKCLPKDLVGSIDVDLSALDSFENMLHISDVVLPAGITVTDNADTVLAKVNAPLTEEQLKAMEETTETSVDDVAVEEKGKTDEEGAAEGGEEKKEEKKEEEKK